MVTVAHIVENIINRRPFLEEAIASGIINYTGLAQLIKKDVEKELRRPVKHTAIMMAIRRLEEKLKEGYFGKGPIKFSGSDISIKSDLFEITIQKSSTAIPTITKFYSIVDFEKGGFLAVTQGAYEITMISNRRYMKKFEEILRNERIVKIIDKLASLSIKIPLEAINTVGQFYVLTKTLGWQDINIVEIVSTLTELTFILDEDDVMSAFSAVKELVKEK